MKYMGTPLELIKQGILKGDLKLVEDGYTALTGETVTKKTEPILDIEPMPYSLEEETDETFEDPDDQFKRQVRGQHKQETRELDDGTIQTEAKREAVDLSKIGAFNMFEDDGETGAEYKDEDRVADKKSSKKPKVNRRKEAKKVTAKCVECFKTFKVMPIHQMDGSFTCTKCINKKRRR